LITGSSQNSCQKNYYTDSVVPLPYPTLVQNGAEREYGLSINKHHIPYPKLIPTRLLQERRTVQKTRNTASAFVWIGSAREEVGEAHIHSGGIERTWKDAPVPTEGRKKGSIDLMFPRQNTMSSSTTTTMQHAKKGLEHMRNDKGIAHAKVKSHWTPRQVKSRLLLRGWVLSATRL
jgi:hypothetical protein